MIIHLKPSDIYYSQDSISRYFQTKKRIGETLDDLCENRLSVSDIKRISVAKVNGRYVTWDNRRLWVFRHLEELGKCGLISVNLGLISVNLRPTIDESRLTTTCGGREVTVRGDPGGFWYKRYKKSIDKRSSNSLFPETIQPMKRSTNKIQYANVGLVNNISNDSSRVNTSSNRPESLYHQKTYTADTTPNTTDSFLDSLWDVAKIGMGLAAMYLISKIR